MLTKFYPDEYHESVFSVDYTGLFGAGITNLIFDIDNTLAPFDTPEPTTQCRSLLMGLKEQGFSVALLSNNKAARVETFNSTLGLVCVWKAKKPKKTGVMRALELLGDAKPQTTALIGDQLFTDIWCARRVGLRAILVRPQSPRDEFLVKIKRYAEKPILWIYNKSN